MPVQWLCPGYPQCMKSYLYRSAMKAHQASCEHAEKQRITRPNEDDSMANIVHFVENATKGNVTIARDHITVYKSVEEVMAMQNRHIAY